MLHIKSISWKIIIMFVSLTIVTISAFVFIIFENQMDLIKDNAFATVEGVATQLKIEAEKVLAANPGDTAVTAKLRAQAQALGVTPFAILTEDGRVLGEARDCSQDELQYLTRAIYKNDFENKFFYHHILQQTKEIEFYIPVAAGKDAAKRWVLKATLKMQIDARLKALYRQCLLVAIFMGLVYLLFILILERLVVNPIKVLNRATIKISEGDFQSKVEQLDEREDEIGLLARTFNKMGDALEVMREEARDANPLTHLPGNAIITKVINQRIKDNQLFAVCYIDLDNFKAYNDKYGFTMGDEAIFYLCENVKKTIEEVGVPKEDFVGHEGGDDFVLVVHPDRMEAIASTLIKHFDGGIKKFYNEEDGAQGFIMSVSRDGDIKKFPFMSISIAIVTNQHRHFVHHSEVVKVAAEMKKKVKAIDGSVYLIDRRKE
jgi:diguanylate cyclase (GGDEF)-like protein